MLNTLVLLKYNNYYARRLKKEPTLQAYLQYQVLQFSNVNFNPNDGVNAIHVVNQPTDMSNYMLVLDEANNIVSRWFILEAKRNLNGQYTIQLRRDLWADYTTDIMNATTFVEKGIAANSDTAIFNDEQVTFNQIKVKEELLKDNTQCQWLVGYYARYTNDDQGNKAVVTLKGEAVNTGDQVIVNRVAGIANWEYYKYVSDYFIGTPETIQYISPMRNRNSTEWRRVSMVNLYPTTIDNYSGFLQDDGSSVASYVYDTEDQVKKVAPTKFKQYTNDLHTKSKTVIDWHNEDETAKFLALDNSNILDTTTNVLYSISVLKNDTQDRFTRADIPLNSSLDQQLLQAFSEANIIATSATRPATKLLVQSDIYKLTLTVIPNYTASYEIKQGRLFTTDAPYDVFAIPYSDAFQFTGNGTTITCSKDIAMAVATDIATLIPSNTVYDIQLLPFCPFDTSAYLKGQYTSSDTKEYSWITNKNNEKVGVIFNISKSDITFNIPLSITVSNVKMDNATKFCRLVSPNYNGQFEFTPAKNNGVNYINVDMTVKPYNPYIHLNPNFGRLYGADYNDARGLICGGDFSIPVINDQWKTYQINNKNYQSMFDRQIENMEVNNKFAQISDITNAIGGTLAGSAAGLIIGGVGGAVAGGAASAIGGVADIFTNAAIRQEALDYTKDQFSMQMGNIKALPNSLVKVSSFNYNNKGFPVVEYYDCNEDEKIAFAKKIMYNGMTINRIDTFEAYKGTWSYSTVSITNPYLKGRLIRFNTEVDGDTHLWNAIAEEMYKGVFYELTE